MEAPSLAPALAKRRELRSTDVVAPGTSWRPLGSAAELAHSQAAPVQQFDAWVEGLAVCSAQHDKKLKDVQKLKKQNRNTQNTDCTVCFCAHSEITLPATLESLW